MSADQRWAVHLLGTDDLHYVDGGMLGAMALAHNINAHRINDVAVHGEKEYLVWAVPVPPNNTAAIVAKQ